MSIHKDGVGMCNHVHAWDGGGVIVSMYGRGQGVIMSKHRKGCLCIGKMCVNASHLLNLLTTALKAYSHAYILMTFIPVMISFIFRIRLSVTRADLNL